MTNGNQNPQATPDVSVVIPAYNAGPYLRESLDSVMAQAGVEFEVIVIDDGSTDETAQILREYGDRIKVLTIANSGGPSIPRNEGVTLSRADLIAFFDAGDVMLPNKLVQAVTELRRHPGAGLFCADFKGIDSTGGVLRERWLATYENFKRDVVPVTGSSNLGILPAALAFRNLLHANFVGTSGVVCRRTTLLETGPFNPDFKNSDDRDMWYRIARGGWDFLFLDEVQHLYRITPHGITARGGQRNKAIIASLAQQLDHVTDPDDLAFIQYRLGELWRGYGYWLRTHGQAGPARHAYQNSLAIRINAKSVVGWLRSW